MSVRNHRILTFACFAIGIVLIILALTSHGPAVTAMGRIGLLFRIIAGVLLRRLPRRKVELDVNSKWYDATEKYHTLTFSNDGRLATLTGDWQRELAALWRLEADVNNGTYLQFLENWGRESFKYASRALKNIGASKMAEIVDACQAKIDLHVIQSATGEYGRLMSNPVIDCNGKLLQEASANLPSDVAEEVIALSFEFMAYPDDIAQLGWQYYSSLIENDE